MKRRAFLPVLLGALMASAVAVPAQAAEPTTIPMFVCDVLEGGEMRVGRRSEVTIFDGWGTSARRQAVKFLERTHVELTVDGSPVANADLLWSQPRAFDPSDPDSGWGVRWEYKLGRLGPGNSVDVNYKLVTDQTHWDGFSNTPPGITTEFNCRVFTRA